MFFFFFYKPAAKTGSLGVNPARAGAGLDFPILIHLRLRTCTDPSPCGLDPFSPSISHFSYKVFTVFLSLRLAELTTLEFECEIEIHATPFPLPFELCLIRVPCIPILSISLILIWSFLRVQTFAGYLTTNQPSSWRSFLMGTRFSLSLILSKWIKIL